ncbi:MAG: hemerythrin domain-containing protein [Rhodospirillaceae bacterium]|nr:hemerythrin domain-containing protein [Rhodospirillaceae bacterium]
MTQVSSSTTTDIKARAKTAKSPDAIKLLKADHAEVAAMFEKFESGRMTAARKQKLAEEICAALSVHAQIEEEILYPAAREVLKKSDMDMVDEAEVEHGSIKELVAAIEADKEGDMFAARVHVMGEWVKHHVKEEETEFFPKLKKSRMDLAEIGARLAERKEELMAETADKP